MQAAGADRFTLDTNILVYAIDASAGLRHEIARQVVLASQLLDCRLTVQAVSEFYWATTRKRIVPEAQAAALVEDWLTVFPAHAASPQSVRRAINAAAAGLASYWDALLVATAAEAGCLAVITEDMSDGARLFGVRLVNPFAPDGISAPAMTLLGRCVRSP